MRHPFSVILVFLWVYIFVGCSKSAIEDSPQVPAVADVTQTSVKADREDPVTDTLVCGQLNFED